MYISGFKKKFKRPLLVGVGYVSCGVCVVKQMQSNRSNKRAGTIDVKPQIFRKMPIVHLEESWVCKDILFVSSHNYTYYL